VSLIPGADERNDRELLAAHVAGDDRAFGVLFARHRDRLWAVALRTTGDREEAADALQDAMVSAFRRAAGFRGDSAVTTWLHRVVVNACLDRLRRRQVRLAEPLPDDLDTDGRGHGSQDAGNPPAEDPADVAVRTDRGRLVRAALATLPVEQRAALVLVDMEGYSVDETAAILGVAPGTVKSRCSRGRARLLPLVAGLVAEPPPERPRPTGDRRSGTEPAGSPSADEGGEQP
jgi:RNA polymerase sigma-70 factor (ECF subfamily)